MPIDFKYRELFDDDVKNAFIGHNDNLPVKLEIFQNIPYIFQKSVKVVTEVRFNSIRVIQQLFKSKIAGIIKRFPRNIAQQYTLHRQVFHRFIFSQYSIFRIGQNTVNSSDDNGQWQNDLPYSWGLYTG